MEENISLMSLFSALVLLTILETLVELFHVSFLNYKRTYKTFKITHFKITPLIMNYFYGPMIKSVYQSIPNCQIDGVFDKLNE